MFIEVLIKKIRKYITCKLYVFKHSFNWGRWIRNRYVQISCVGGEYIL